MGLFDKLTDRITKRAEDNVVRSVDRSVDKAMDTDNAKRKSAEHKAKKEAAEKEKAEIAASKAAGSGTNRKKCTGCGFVTKDNFCSKCGSNLTSVEYMTDEELDEYLNRD